MEKSAWSRIVVLGTGNLAWSLLPALAKALEGESELWGRQKESARGLLAHSHAVWHTIPPCVSREKEEPASAAGPHTLYFVCLPDAMLAQAMVALDSPHSLVIHCSGATPLIPLKEAQSAVLYPLQTFTRGRVIDFSQIPLYVEGSSDEALQAVSDIAHSLSAHVSVCPTSQRLNLHIIGVLTNNFITHLLTLTSAYCSRCQIEENAYRPLLQETIDKVMSIPPYEAQTGPARRNDLKTIRAHQELLTHIMPSLLPVYNALTESILALYNPDRGNS